ncbi:MAG TPA: response regulator [Bacteroidales bacterium]|nr:response regulator [Bacteroidales bacterium]
MKSEDHTILVVEDDEASREFLSEVIGSLGYKLITAKNGREGIDHFKKYGADLILLDIRLPDINGIEVLERLKEHSPEIPVIAQTAFAMQQEREEFLSRGFDGYISKPVKPEALASAILKFLGDGKN